MVVAMILGGIVYNPRWINMLLPDAWQLSVELAHRLPVLLVFLQALACLAVCWQMREPERHSTGLYPGGSSIGQAFALTWRTARWVVTHPVTLVVVILGVVIDSIVRNFATISSSYFRLVELPAWSYGLLGALMGVFGFFVPGIALKLNQRFSLLTNLGLIGAAAALSMLALVPAWPYYGLIPAMLLMSMMWFLGFTVSRVLHQQADSSQRATVLSVKGMIFNLGYGLFSLGFSLMLAQTQRQNLDTGLQQALVWQLPYFVVVMGGLLVWARVHLKGKSASV